MKKSVKFKYSSLEDFLISKKLNINAELDDGWGVKFPVKGKEIQATILFADISRFSSRTLDLTPAETLVLVNNFFTWISAEALLETNGIIDKYIGDELMMVFSEEFGSENSFIDAIKTALWMCRNDAFNFSPHIGIATGPVIVGYIGTPIKYNCSVFGKAVTVAARCASSKIVDDSHFSSSISFPEELWENYDLDTIFPPIKMIGPDGSPILREHHFELLPSQKINFKNMGDHSIQTIVNRLLTKPGITIQERAEIAIVDLMNAGLYNPESDLFIK